MQRRYTISGDQNAAATITILGMTSAATIRPAIYFFTIGSAATPADQASSVKLLRFTAAGTSTAFTPIAHDPGDPASLAAGGYNHTVEPTYTASSDLYHTSFNQQNTIEYETLPQFGFKAPATAANGIGIRFIVATGTALHEASLFFAE